MSSLTIGGSERKTVLIANELHQRGCNVRLAYLNPPTTLAGILNAEIPIICLERRGKVSLPAIKTLARYIEQERVSKIVCINLYPLIYALAARWRLPTEAKPQVILAINSTQRHGLRERMAMALYSRLMKSTNEVIFGCQAQLELWSTQYGLNKERCTVVYNGVDHEKFSSSSVHKERSIDGIILRGFDFVIGSVGQLRPVKNQMELIRALAHLRDRLPNAKLVLVGDGPERNRLSRVAREAGLLDRIWFLGQREDVRPILEVLDLFVVPSISETFSNAALEAMSMGKAVILSDTGGAREMVQDGVNGYIYPQGNTEVLAALIEEVAADSKGRSILGKNARKAVLERFSFARMVSDYQRLLL